MSFDSYREYRERASECRANGAFDQAGHYYTAAAHEALGHANYASESLDHGQVNTARGLRSTLAAALCYRLAETIERCRIRCSQGILLAEEIRDYTATYEPQQGIMWEYIGDFRVIADRQDWMDAYDMAASYYEDCNNVIGWLAEPEFETNMAFMLTVADAVEYDIDRQTKSEITASSLDRRIAYKREHFKKIISKVVSRGEWT